MPLNLDPYMRRVETANRRIADKNEAVGVVVNDLLRGTIAEAEVADDLPAPEAPPAEGPAMGAPPTDDAEVPMHRESYGDDDDADAPEKATEPSPDDDAEADPADDDGADDFADDDDEESDEDDGLDDLGLDDDDEPPADAP